MKGLFKRAVGLLLTVLLPLAFLSASGTAVPEAFLAKAGNELLPVVADAAAGELLPVWIFLKDLEEETVGRLLKERTGIEERNFKDYASFEQNIVQKTRRELTLQLGAEAAASPQLYDAYLENAPDQSTLVPKEGGRFFEDPATGTVVGRSLAEAKINEKVDAYILEKRKLCRELFTESNTRFARDHFRTGNRILYQSPYSPTFVVELTKQQIYAAARDSRVEKIGLYQYAAPVGFGDEHTNAQVRANEVHALGYKGSGVTVGIFENQFLSEAMTDNMGAQFTPNVQLNDPRFIFRDCRTSQADPLIRKAHATSVCGILVGNPRTLSGVKLEGVASGVSKMIQYPIGRDPMDAYYSAHNLLQSGGTLISWSGGLSHSEPGYTYYDQEMDYFIKTYGVTVVCAVGNSEDESRLVASPARAFNTIAVGNAKTKTDGVTPAAAPYTMATNSVGYTAISGMPNKPDIAAPGVNIRVSATDDTLSTARNGTSYATPHVAGAVALMMQKNAYYKTNPMVLKTVLMNGADSSKISTTDNPAISGSRLRKRSGAGFLDAKAAFDFLSSDYLEMFEFTTWLGPSEYTDWNIETVHLPSNYRIRVTGYLPVMDTNHIPANFMIAVTDSAGTILNYSATSTTNNVQMFEYTVPVGGYYTIRARIHGTLDQATFRPAASPCAIGESPSAAFLPRRKPEPLFLPPVSPSPSI